MSTQTNKFKRASRIAKKLYKTGRYKMYSDAMKAAFNTLARKPKKKKVGSTLLLEKKDTRRTKPKRVVRITRTKTGTFKNWQTISGYMNGAKKMIENKIALCEVRKFKASTRRAKNTIAKQIAELKRKYNRLT
jgi:hypothetical protein